MTEKKCMACIKQYKPNEKGQLKSLISEHGTMLASVNPRPNSKAHTVIVTKRHTEDLCTLTDQEWADILPVLKESIAKIEKVYKPIGYWLNIPTGELAGQNMPQHFYMRVVPKYGVIGKGSTGIREHYKSATPEQEKEINEALSPNKDNIVAERSKVFAKLRNDRFPGYAIILTKACLSPDINKIDQETWNQIGEILKELMKKYETKINCHNFFIGCNLGHSGKLVAQEKGETPPLDRDICFTFFPKYKMERWWMPNEGRPVRNNQPVGTMEMNE